MRSFLLFSILFPYYINVFRIRLFTPPSQPTVGRGFISRRFEQAQTTHHLCRFAQPYRLTVGTGVLDCPLRTNPNCTLSLLSTTELNSSPKVPTLVGSIRGTNAGTSYESPGTKGRRACARLTRQSSHCAVLPFGNLTCFPRN